MRNIKIFDTTLRDGEQAPGCSMNPEEKLEVARQLERLGVDVIEAGFPISSKGDFDSVAEIASSIKDSTVCGLARAVKADIDCAYEAIKRANSARIHLFLATSPIHMRYKLKKSPEEVLALTAQMTAYARSLCADVEFSAEDATRSEPEFLAKVVRAALSAGATTINIPDTVGYTTPEEMRALIEYLRGEIPELDAATLSVHCHNDLGCATANSLSGVLGGAGQIECTINGIGERAGNTALEEVVMALRTRHAIYNADCRIDATQIYRSSKLIYNIMGMSAPLNKAIVGVNTFKHESGIHQHGVLAAKETYEIISPESIGKKPNKMVLGKHSGRHAFEERLSELGFELTSEQLDFYFEKFKEICDKKKTVSDRDLEALISARHVAGVYTLDRFDVHTGNHTSPSCVIRLRRDDEVFEEVALGDGPISAAYNAIDKIMHLPEHRLENYTIRSTSEGRDTLGEVMVKVSCDGENYNGRGLSTDIIESSILAYLHAVNKLVPIGKDKPITIRRFKPEDAAPLSELIRHTLFTSNSSDYTPEQLADTAMRLSPEGIEKRASWTHFYVACEGERPIGCGAIGPYYDSKDESSLFNIFVHPEHQGKGIGKLIVDALERDEYFERSKRIEVPASVTARGFYEKRGYRAISELPDEHRHIRMEKVK